MQKFFVFSLHSGAKSLSEDWLYKPCLFLLLLLLFLLFPAIRFYFRITFNGSTVALIKNFSANKMMHRRSSLSTLRLSFSSRNWLVPRSHSTTHETMSVKCGFCSSSSHSLNAFQTSFRWWLRYLNLAEMTRRKRMRNVLFAHLHCETKKRHGKSVLFVVNAQDATEEGIRSFLRQPKSKQKIWKVNFNVNQIINKMDCVWLRMLNKNNNTLCTQNRHYATSGRVDRRLVQTENEEKTKTTKCLCRWHLKQFHHVMISSFIFLCSVTGFCVSSEKEFLVKKKDNLNMKRVTLA